ncbi:hypothetical protein VTJ83DRAFT_3795 [Remersonia thermophila]|uniref:Inositol polyphosphate-related phosphatase domain-containing protein n=1 Tax=Remersonia thermophila TaxID=72144 RepID=A0ABR4DHB2_9PEZI
MASSGTPPHSPMPDTPDPLSTNAYSLHRAVRARRAEYIRSHRLRIKIGTWNVAACPGTDKDLARWFVDGEGLDPALGSSSKPPDAGAPEWTGFNRGSSTPQDDEAIQLAGDKIGLYVLGLQEVNVLTAPSQYMTWIYGADEETPAKWKEAVEAALPEGYQLVVSELLAGMLLLVYASPEIAPIVSNVSTSAVGAGALGYLGNKGGVCARIVLGEATQLVFVNSHLASGVEDYYLERRIGQVEQVVAQARFEPLVISGVAEEESTKLGDEDFAFWFGDLNFRLDRLPGDDIRRLLMLHTRGEYDLSKKGLRRESSLDGEPIVVHHEVSNGNEEPDAQQKQPPEAGDGDDDSLNLPDPDEFPENPHDDPASLQSTLDSLLPHDQLRRMVKERKVFHDGWREGPISFLPTYKYDVGTVALFDSSEKRRPPSWCDRILYRTRRDLEKHIQQVQEEEARRRRDEELKARGVGEDDDEDVLFSYDPETDGEEQPKPQTVGYDEYDDADDGQGDGQGPDQASSRIHLELYTSHQRITSSDHKPVSAIFHIHFDAAVPELKAKVHAEVARLLDRAENEGRPVVTVVLDHHDGRPAQGGSESSAPQVDMGDVEFLKKYTASLTLANTGGVPATVSFVEKPGAEDSGDESNQVPWLTTSFVHAETPGDDPESVDLEKEVTLQPGETLGAVLDVLVDDVRYARMLNEGEAALEDVLVLRVANGRDHFIPVRASWSPTSVGRSVEELIRVPDGGIRSLARLLLEERGKLGAIPYSLPVHRPAPKELFRLTEAVETMTQRVVAESQMLDDLIIPAEPGWPFDEDACVSADSDTRRAHVVCILRALDLDQPVQTAFAPETPALERLEAVAQTLLLFLRGLTDGIIPTPLWNRIDQAALSIPALANPSTSTNVSAIPPTIDDTALDNDRTTVLDILQSAPNHNICFVFLTTTLARIVSELSPLTKSEWDALRNDPPTSPTAVSSSAASVASSSISTTSSASSGAAAVARGIGGVLGGVGRKSLSLVRRNTVGTNAQAIAALERRRAREKRIAEVFADVVCRSGGLDGAEGKLGVKERRIAEARRRAVLELFLMRRE